MLSEVNSCAMNFSHHLLIHFTLLLCCPPPPSLGATDVPPLYQKEALPTESGYLPTNSGDNTSSSATLFFAFYEAQQPLSPFTDTPLLVWLQGGPGCSSMLGNLFELGPWLLADDLLLHHNPFSWNRRFALLFIDSPIGTGYSPAPSPADIPRDQPAVAAHLFSALHSFLSSHPRFHSRPLFLTGESYAGKYIPATGHHILHSNLLLPPSLRINLAGVAIGNGLTHPVAQVETHAAAAYFSGLINDRQRTQLEQLQGEAAALARESKWPQAIDARNRALQWLQNATGLATLKDIRKKRPYATAKLQDFLNKEEVKAVLGVRKEVDWVSCRGDVHRALHDDVMKSTKYLVEELLKSTRMLLYQGIFDLIDGVASTEAWMKEMKWEGIGNFLAAERRVWRVQGEVAGYLQRWSNLTHVVVSGAGHLVPADQGLSSQAMIESWVMQSIPFGEE